MLDQACLTVALIQTSFRPCSKVVQFFYIYLNKVWMSMVLLVLMKVVTI